MTDMILRLIFWCALILTVLVVAQRLIDAYGKDNESSRKLVHVLHGVGLAGLAFLLPLQSVVIVELVFLWSIFVARYLYRHAHRLPSIKYLGKMYNVGRTSYGDFFFPMSAIALVFLANSKWEFATMVLVLGLADAAAALVGKRYGQSSSYVIFGQRKSLAGSIAFYAVTFCIVGGFMLLHGSELSAAGLGTLLWISFILTITENLGVYGSDNLLIPLVGVVLLNRL